MLYFYIILTFVCKLCVHIFRTHNSKIRIMDTYNLNGITVAAILDNRRETKSGTYPVKIRVTYKRDRKYYSTGKNLSVSEWEKLEKTKNTELLCIKKDLQITYSSF